MTACVNKKSKRVAAVVTASLVGALSIGAPAVALAANANIDFQVAPAEDAFSRGSIKLTGVNGTGTEADPYTQKANADGSALDIKVTEVTPLGADKALKLDDESYEVVFAKADGTVVEKVVEPGSYNVTVKALKGVYAGSSVSTKLKVTAAKLTDVKFFDAGSTLEDKTQDDSLTYTGKKLSIGFASDSAEIVEGVDYEVKVLKKGTDNVSSAAGLEILEAGDYVAYLTGKGQYAGETAEIPVHVDKFNFAKAEFDEIDLFSSDSAPVHPTRVYVGTEDEEGYAELDPSLVDLTFASGPSTDLFDKTGAYTFNASYKDAENIEGDAKGKTVKVNKIGKVADFKFDGSAIKDSYLIDLSKESQSVISGGKFNWDSITVYNGETKLAKGTNYTVTVADEDGVAGQYDNLQNLVPGTYKVTVCVKPETVSHEVGGSVTFTVKVVDQVVDADANVFVYDADGKVVTSFEKVYDGEKFDFSKISIKAFNDKGEKIEDDTLSFVLFNSDGKVVQEKDVKNAGSYTLKVVSDKLELNGETELPVIINKVDLSTLKVNSLVPHFGAAYLPLKDAGYSYSELDLRFDTHVADSDENDKAADKEGWDALTFGTWGSKTKFEMFDEDKGEWVSVTPGKAEGVVRVTLSGDKNDAVNYKFANADNTTVAEFLVTDAKKVIFNDVKPGDWFFDVVFKAQSNKWMNGYPGTKVFGSEKTITRGEVACVLYNIASFSDKVNEHALGYDETYGWNTGFSDVDGKQFYGKPIAWAKHVGVVNGYGDGTFAPDAPVTREELACMLANYAKVVDTQNTAVEDVDKVLGTVSDGSAVSGWAKGSVAWAVENEIMGNAGFVNALNDITRAEVAAMVVNYKA